MQIQCLKRTVWTNTGTGISSQGKK